MAISLSLQLITVSLTVLQRQREHNLIGLRTKWYESYDYIVVGAGSAGCVVANRLSANPYVNVLLLEAGSPQTVLSDIPGVWTRAREGSTNWNYTSVPQKDYGLAYGGLVDESRGKTIGGTSSINGMVYSRGNRKDFDVWVTEYGAKGWSYAEVLPYFKKSENNSDFNIVRQNGGYHGTSGPLGISSVPNPQKILVQSLRAMNELGFKTIDVNGPEQVGTYIPQEFIDETTGFRASVSNAYIDPNPHPNNLHILTNAFVVKILTNKSKYGLKAIGVQFVKDNELYEVMAKKEIIISAGAFNSPQLLMLSGIGPKDHLKSMNIEVKADLPVGDHLQEHPQVINIFSVLKDQSDANIVPELNVQQMYELFTNHSGPLSRRNVHLTFYSTSSIREKDWPNIVMFNDITVLDKQYIESQFKSRLNEWKDYLYPYLGRKLFSSGIWLMRVRSFGSLRLASTNPYVHPYIEPRYLSHPQDFEDVVESIKNVFHFLTESSIANYVYPIPAPIPGCDMCMSGPVYECDSYIRCVVRQLGNVVWHPSGTCRMGSANRKDVVVDPELKVLGVSSLRVCDASVMPLIPNSNLNAPAIMIGEKCSDLVQRN